MFSPPGRKTSITEKPIPPPEPAEPVLCGSMAIGAVSLAIAKTSAALDRNPLYFSIASLKHQQVSVHYIPAQGAWASQSEWTMFLISSCFGSISGTASKANYSVANGISGQLWEVIVWEAELNERSDLYTPSWING